MTAKSVETALPSPKGYCSGFSLVEVTLALGVMSFALVAIMGMLPVGMDTFRKSVDTTVHAQIAQQIVNTIQQTGFDQIRDAAVNPSGDYYFDDEGFAASRDGWTYHARLSVPADDDDGTIVPSERQDPVNPGLRTACIEIAKNGNVDDIKEKNPTQVKMYTFVLADLGL